MDGTHQDVVAVGGDDVGDVCQQSGTVAAAHQEPGHAARGRGPVARRRPCPILSRRGRAGQPGLCDAAAHAR